MSQWHCGECLVACPDSQPFLFNQTCVSDCPADTELYSLYDNGYNSIAICMNECPSNMLLDVKKCKNKCSEEKHVFNGTCVQNCPSSHPLITASSGQTFCVTQCKNNI